MKKRRKLSDDTSLKDSIVFLAMPFIGWLLISAIVYSVVALFAGAP